MKSMSRRLSALAVLVLALGAKPAFAIDTFSITSLTGLTDTAVTDMLKTVAIGTDHRAYMPATSQGMLLGFDIGVDMTLVKVPAEFGTAMALVTGQAASGIPTTVPVPRFSAHKGLPFGVDLGMSFMSYQGLFKSIGFDAKYELLGGLALPAVAIRASYGHSNLWFINTSTFKVDVVASKNLLIIDPYVGAGMAFWSGDITVPTGLTSPVSASAKGSAPHFYAGVPLKLAMLRLTGEIDYSTAGVTTYGAKVSFGF